MFGLFGLNNSSNYIMREKKLRRGGVCPVPFFGTVAVYPINYRTERETEKNSMYECGVCSTGARVRLS